MLLNDKTSLALTPNFRAHLKMILEDDYVVPRKDILNQDKPKEKAVINLENYNYKRSCYK